MASIPKVDLGTQWVVVRRDENGDLAVEVWQPDSHEPQETYTKRGDVWECESGDDLYALGNEDGSDEADMVEKLDMILFATLGFVTQ